MGYIRHHAIIVTSWDDDLIEAAWKKAVELFPPTTVSAILSPVVNGYTSFVIGPDGSKEGWDASFEGDTRREAFIAWLNGQRYEDGSTSFDWAEVQYGDENGDNRVLHHDAEQSHANA